MAASAAPVLLRNPAPGQGDLVGFRPVSVADGIVVFHRKEKPVRLVLAAGQCAYGQIGVRTPFETGGRDPRPPAGDRELQVRHPFFCQDPVHIGDRAKNARPQSGVGGCRQLGCQLFDRLVRAVCGGIRPDRTGFRRFGQETQPDAAHFLGVEVLEYRFGQFQKRYGGFLLRSGGCRKRHHDQRQGMETIPVLPLQQAGQMLRFQYRGHVHLDEAACENLSADHRQFLMLWIGAGIRPPRAMNRSEDRPVIFMTGALPSSPP